MPQVTDTQSTLLDRLPQPVAETWRFIAFIWNSYLDDDCQNTAAALTYQTLFAIVPALTVTFTVLSAFTAFGNMGATLENFLFENIVPENVSVVKDYLRSFSDQARSLSAPALIFLAVTAFLMLYTIEGTFNEIWQIKEPRHGFQRLMMYWAVLTLGPVLVGAGIAITTYVLSLPLVSDVGDSPLMLRLLPLILSVATFTLVYLAVPNTTVPLRHAVQGGLLVAVVFESAKVAFAFFVSRSSIEVIYGTFAVVPLFLLWIYVSWTIVLVGAELVKSLGVYQFKGKHRVEAPLYQMLLILNLFYRAHQRGEVVHEAQVRTLSDRIDMGNWTSYRQQLTSLNLIRQVDRGGLMLARDLSEFSLWQLYTSLPWKLPTACAGGDAAWEEQVSGRVEQVMARNREAFDIDLETLFKGMETG